LFAHYAVPAEKLQPLVPRGLRAQEFDGTSWVGVVPFRMEGVSPRPLPDLPGISAFPELNLRLYVEAGGRPGVWFVSLDAANALAVWAARRWFHLPYFNAKMSVKREGERIAYSSERAGKKARVAFRGSYGPTSSAYESKRGGIEHFLTERYCLYAERPDGALLRAQVHHVPWPLQRAEADIEECSVAEPQGIELGGPPVLLHFARRIDVVVWNVELVAS
jgi:uncharacterized protein YqjF (DUF2071 family)